MITNKIRNIKRINDEFNYFYSTKLMFENYNAIDVFSLVFQALEETSDEQWFEKKYPNEIFKDKEKEVKRKFVKSAFLNLVNQKIKITDVAKKYGLDVDKKGRTLCPFHNDNDPSLFLSDDKNIFHCFGCNAKGNILTFIKKMEKEGYERKK
ncbi:MAG TPA: CHC2 zinc finger domain-containing protein [Candidatus Paceibacterota bacterium]|nr:CHC2 zinc finger domain-containing protein [Candidatus Paceibacterota bacterium]